MKLGLFNQECSGTREKNPGQDRQDTREKNLEHNVKYRTQKWRQAFQNKRGITLKQQSDKTDNV